MANLESIKIHTMRDDLSAGQTNHPALALRQSVSKPLRQNKPFPVNSKNLSLPIPPNNNTLYLPVKPKKIQRPPALWFIIGAAVLLILNVIIWSIAIIE